MASSAPNEVRLERAYTKDARELKRALPNGVIKGQGSPVWRSVIEAVESFGPAVAEERRVILLVSDGHNGDPLTKNSITEEHAAKAAQAAEVMIYCVGMKPSWKPVPLVEQVHPSLSEVAAETGGRYVEIGEGTSSRRIASAFAGIAEELHAQYLLGFEPPLHDGKVHRITVWVARQGMNSSVPGWSRMREKSMVKDRFQPAKASG